MDSCEVLESQHFSVAAKLLEVKHEIPPDLYFTFTAIMLSNVFFVTTIILID